MREQFHTPTFLNMIKIARLIPRMCVVEAKTHTRTIPLAYVLEHDQDRAPHPQGENPYAKTSTRLHTFLNMIKIARLIPSMCVVNPR